jgi:ADP-heptose:LPS heptosyltransferase
VNFYDRKPLITRARNSNRPRPVTPLPARGRLRRLAKGALRSILMPAAGAAAAVERRVRGLSAASNAGRWPYPESPRRALIVRLDLLGDCLLTLPAAAALKQAHPGLHITFLAARGTGGLLRLSPAVDEVIECDLAGLTHLRALSDPGNWGSGARLLARIRRARFDIAVSAYGPLARAVVSLSLARHRIADGCGWPAVEHQRRIRPGEHEIDHLLNLVASARTELPKPVLAIAGPAPPELARGAVLCPGTRSGSAKSWPTANWIRLAEELSNRGFKLLIVGAADEVDKMNRICASLPQAVNLAGKLSLEQLAGIISQARLVVGVDSMPIHMASMLGAPTLGLFGPTDPRRYRPRGNGRALAVGIGCAPCYDQRAPPECPFGDRLCMKWLEPDRVLAEALELAGA